MTSIRRVSSEQRFEFVAVVADEFVEVLLALVADLVEVVLRDDGDLLELSLIRGTLVTPASRITVATKPAPRYG